jgi:hypothetical protein
MASLFRVSLQVLPQFLSFELFKEIRQGNIACEPRNFIAAEAPPSAYPGE